jgi:hypothetical protein
MTRNFATFCFAVFTAFLSACGGTANTNTNTAAVPNCDAGNDRPTAAYQRLFEAVKSKQTESIKQQLTEATVQFAGSISAQNKTPLEKVFENGFTATTFAPTLPDIRDERINCNMGAIEVWNANEQKWEDLPFMIENGKWKLAVGELFRGIYKSPGKGLATREAEAANRANGNMIQALPNSSSNTNKPNRMPVPPNTVNGSRNK